MKKPNLVVVVAVIAVLSIALYYLVYVPSLPPPELETVKMAMLATPDLGYWEYAYADYGGFYEEEGIEVEIEIVRGWTEALDALVAGDIQFIYAPDLAISGALMGAPVKAVLVTASPNYVCVGRPGIETIQDVKKFATAGMDPLTVEIFERSGLKENEDFEMINMDYTAWLPSLLRGDVDACGFGAATVVPALEANCTILFSYGEELPEYAAQGLCTNDAMIREKPDVVKGMIKAIYRSIDWIMEHKEEAIEYAVNEFEVDREFAVFQYEFAYEGKYGDFRLTPDMPKEMLEWTMAFYAQFMYVEEIPFEQYADSSFIEEVKAELGVS